MTPLPSGTESEQGSRAGASTPFVGRSQELLLLEDALSDAVSGRTPHTITLMGAAGVGKSRLALEFLAQVRADHPDVRVLATLCREGASPLGFIRGVLCARCGIAETANASMAELALRRAVGEVTTGRRAGELVHFLGLLMGLDLDGSALSEAIGTDAALQRRVACGALRRFVELDARKTPLLIVVEDLHLADADSIELLRELVSTVAGAPILFLVMARPELVSRYPAWLSVGGESVRFDLAPLQPDDAADLVERMLAPVGEVPDELVDEVVERAQGNPRLVEEVVRSLTKQGVIVHRSDARWEVDLARLPRAQVPLRVEDAIQARIGALSAEERALLEMAAALGGVFWLGVLLSLERAQGAAPRLWSDPQAARRRIEAALDALVERDYVMRLPDSSIAGDTEYAFKHNLEREALQGFAGKQSLARYHQVIALWLELRLPEGTEEQHELLADHCEAGGLPARAAQHRLLAADAARARGNPARAAEGYRRALALLCEGEDLLRLTSLERWGESLLEAGKRDAALAAFDELRTLAYQLDLPPPAANAQARLGLLHGERGELVDALEYLDAAHSLYAAVGDHHAAALARSAMAKLHVLCGNFAAAEHMLSEALGVFEERQDVSGLARATCTLGTIYRGTQRLAAAREACKRALALFRSTDDQAGVAEALTCLGLVHDYLGDTAQAQALWSEAQALAEQCGDQARRAAVLTCRGAAAYRSGQTAEAMQMLSQAESLAEPLGDPLALADTRRSLAKARALIGDYEGAFEDIGHAIEVFERAMCRPQLAAALRTCAEIAIWAGPTAVKPAEADPAALLSRSMEISETLGDDLELARSARTYAEYLTQGGADSPATADRVAEAQRLNERAEHLLRRHEGITMRAAEHLKRV